MGHDTRHNPQSGIAAVEFGLILPIFALLFFGIIEMGFAGYKQQVITGAAREAGRYGILAIDPRPTADQVVGVARNFIDDAGLDQSQVVVNVTGAGGQAGDPLQVHLQYPTHFDFLAQYLPSSASINATTLLNARMAFVLQ